MGGKGKGKGGPPPPPSGEAAAKAKAESEAKIKARFAEQRLQALQAIADNKAIEAAREELRQRISSLRPIDFYNVKWDTAKMNVHLVGGKGVEWGAGGIDIVEFEDGVTCVRRGSTIGCELLAEAIAITLDVRIARMRLVHEQDPEYSAIFDMSARLTPCIAGPTFPALSLSSYLERLDTAHEKLSALSDRFLADLGRLCALDLLLNNFDRIPLPCWTNQGNFTNVIVTHKGDLVGIDQQVNVIEAGPGLDKYLGCVRSLATCLFQANGSIATCEDGMSLASVSQGIQAAMDKHCGVELSDASMQLVLEGMRSGLLDADKKWRSGDIVVALDAAAASAANIVMESAISQPEQAAQQVAFVKRILEVVSTASPKTAA